MTSFWAFLKGGPAPRAPAVRTPVVAVSKAYWCRQCDVWFAVPPDGDRRCWCCGDTAHISARR